MNLRKQLSKKIKELEENKLQNKTKYYTTTSPVSVSIKINYIFWISVISSVIIISYYTTGHSWNSYISGIFTYIFIAFWGYLMHYISHSVNFTDLYKNSTSYILSCIHKIPILNIIEHFFIIL